MQESDQLTLFAEDTLASHLVVPGSAEARRMTATSGRRCIELFARSCPVLSFVKMLLGMSAWDSTRCLLTWSVRTTPRKRLLFRLRASAPRTRETEFSLWLGTLTASGKKRSKTYRGNRVPNPHEFATMFPTPTACGNNNRRGASGKAGDGLATAIKRLLPTPTAQDARNATLPRSQAGRDSVPGYLLRTMYATPQARDYRTGQSERWDNPDRSRNLNDQVGGSLNPDWVEWLMGFPRGWTDPDAQGSLPERDPRIWDEEPPEVPRLSQGTPRRAARVKALGNAVVPQQAYPIFAAIISCPAFPDN